MGLVPGTRLGRYEIVAQIGVGGMGEVYRARDTNLDRHVAIKILPEAFARDHDRLARFEREAKTLASLNHPNIAIIHGLEEGNGIRALVMELVEGPTLADRVAQAALPVDQALPIAKQIAEALEAAHEQGIIHRDLKPANVKVREDGVVKVLDFGLAKAFAHDNDAMSSPSVTNSPTLASPGITGVGVLLGTAAYMAPEQAKGKSLTKAADIWAFGCVLYELLTGRAAFHGDDVTEILAAVVRGEPDWSQLPVTTPHAIQRLLRHCLHKDPRRRWQDAASLRIVIDDVLSTTAGDATTGVAPRSISRRQMAAIAGVTLLAALASAVLAWSVKPGPAPATVARLLIGVTPADRLARTVALGNGRPFRTSIALSPDGQSLVFVGEQGRGRQLYLRTMDRLDAKPIPGTELSDSPFFSPDGRWIGFWQTAAGRGGEGELRKVSIDGGPVVTVCQTPPLWGVSWGSHGRIVFANRAGGGLLEVPEGGGTPQMLTKIDQGNGAIGHMLPHVLPGGNALLYTVRRSPLAEDSQIVVRLLESGSEQVLVEGASDARYVSGGHLVYAQKGTLMAVPFDLRRLVVTGTAVGVVDDVMHDVNTSFAVGNSGSAQIALSSSGTLAYVMGGISQTFVGSPVWVDRAGVATPLTLPRRDLDLWIPRVSPDGKRVLFSSIIQGLWIYDVTRESLSQLARDAGPGIWHPDGQQVAFPSVASKTRGTLFLIPADGSGRAEQLAAAGGVQSWSPDGKTLAFVDGPPGQRTNLWALPTGDRSAKPYPLVQSAANESGAEFSPDGRYLAYVSNQSGRNEVYVQPYPGPGRRETISTNGGAQPVWAANRRELFYRETSGPAGRIMVVDVTLGETFTAGRPRALFDVDSAEYPPGVGVRMYDVAPDGTRFLMIRKGEGSAEPPITQIVVVQHFDQELTRLVPVK